MVDDAIVIVEDITRRIQEGQRPIPAAFASMNELLGAVIATSLVLIAVFVPVAFFPGTTGQLYKQFALTIAFSITVSTFNAITFTPMFSALLIRNTPPVNNWFFNGINFTIDAIRGIYHSSLILVSKAKGLVLVIFAICFGLTYYLYTLTPTAFLPDEDQGYFITFVQAPEGVSLGYTERVLEKAEGIMKQFPEIENIFAVGGFSFSGSVPNQGIIFCTLKPWSERTRPEQSAKGLINQLFPRLLAIQEAFVIPISPPAIIGLGDTGGFEFYIQDRTNQGFGVLAQSLFQFLGVASTFPSTPENPAPPRVVGIRPELSVSTPQISVQVDRETANLLQVSLSDVFNTLQIALGSRYVNDFNTFGRAYRVYVQADQQFRSTPDDITKLYVRSQTGAMIPLSNLVKIEQIVAPSIINHYNLFRSAKLTGSAAPGVSSGQVIETLETVAKSVLPRGIGYEWSGLSLEEIESGGQGLIIFGFGLIFVFLILSAQYENFIDPLIIMLTVPLAILGALIAVLARGLANDVYTQIGFVMLIGMASKNSILIVELANQLRQQGCSITKAAITASEQRLRPILMTALSTMIGVLPLVLASGAGASARQSLGTAVMGGMAVATALSLFIAPVLYILIKTAQQRFTGDLLAVPVADIQSNGTTPLLQDADAANKTLSNAEEGD